MIMLPMLRDQASRWCYWKENPKGEFFTTLGEVEVWWNWRRFIGWISTPWSPWSQLNEFCLVNEFQPNPWLPSTFWAVVCCLGPQNVCPKHQGGENLFQCPSLTGFTMLYLSIQYLLGRGIWPPNASQIICFIHKSHQFTFCVLLSSASTDIRYDMRVEVVYISMDMLIYIYFIFVYKRDFDIHAKHQISLCVYIWIYECISISIHLHTFYNIYFLLCSPWPQSLLPQPNHWHIQASTVPRSDGLRLFSAPSKEFGTPNEGNGGRKGRGGLGSTAASEEQGLQNTALKVSLVFFFFFGGWLKKW